MQSCRIDRFRGGKRQAGRGTGPKLQVFRASLYTDVFRASPFYKAAPPGFSPGAYLI